MAKKPSRPAAKPQQPYQSVFLPKGPGTATRIPIEVPPELGGKVEKPPAQPGQPAPVAAPPTVEKPRKPTKQ